MLNVWVGILLEGMWLYFFGFFRNSLEEFVDGYLRCKPCNKAVDEQHLSTAAWTN